MSIQSPAGHGAATVSGATVTYVPEAGFSGTDSFTYTATNVSGTSAIATVTITVTAPTLEFSPAAGPLASGTVGAAYDGATIAASEGGGEYVYLLTGSLPEGMAFDAGSGSISGTPREAGEFSFTVSATDQYGATGSASYALSVAVPDVDFSFTPPAGALPSAMAGEGYNASISASGGVEPLLYEVVTGALPDGLVLNVSTGELTGPLDKDTEGDYGFTIEVRDANGSNGTANYTLAVAERVVSVTDKDVEAPDGEAPENVDLAEGATGRPFVDANIVAVVPANAGTASIVHARYAQAGGGTPPAFYLKFTPNPGFSGTAHVHFQLVSALGTSNVGTVSYTLGFDAAAVVSEIDGLVHDFIRTRSGLIASSIKVPNLLERRRMQAGMEPVTWSLSPRVNGLALNFAASTAQANAALNAVDGLLDVGGDPFNIWLDATVQVHNRGQDTHRWGTFAMVSAGADYLLTDKALVGVSFHHDRMTDPLEPDAALSGNGWLAGPYASIELGEGVFWDASLLYGGSSNTIDTAFWDGTFDTRRWLFDTTISGVWRLDDATTLTPSLKASYVNETILDYEVRNAQGATLGIEGFTTEQFRIGLGAELAHSFVLDDGAILTPSIGLTGGFSGLDGSGAFGQISAGATLNVPDAFTVDVGLSFSTDASGRNSAGAKIGIRGQF